MLRAPEVLVMGGGPLADAVQESLRRRHRRVDRLPDADRLGARLRGGSTLILTAGAELDRALSEVAARRVRQGQTSPRILLLSDAQEPLEPCVSEAVSMPYVERVDLERTAARLLLARWPLHVGCDPLFGQQVHLVIVGRTALADALLVHALRIAHYSEREPVMTLLSEVPERWQQAFAAVHPQAETFSRLRFRALDEPALGGEPPVCGVVVCAHPPDFGLERAESLVRTIAEQQGVSPPVLLDIGDAEPVGDLGDWDGQILPFSYRRLVLTPEVLLDGRGDELARVIHDHYRDTSAAQGRNPDAEPSSRPWSDLADSYRHANRHQADHLWAKLAVTDCRAVPEEMVESFAFAPAEVERLAIIEHARWAADRYLDGWSYAPTRDNARKHHPQLIRYADLSGPMKDLDRFAVRLVPALLARSGQGVVRMLIVGIPETMGSIGIGSLRARVDQLLLRLRARYPDRGLVIAATLADAASRLLARRALHLADAGLFLLCPRPLAETLAAQPNQDARIDLLGLVARVERRIPLPGEGELDRWFAERAEILVQIDAAPLPATIPPENTQRQNTSRQNNSAEHSASETSAPSASATARKRVRITADQGIDWNFEY
jgi:hypothetical protein